MKASIEIVKMDVSDIVTTSVPEETVPCNGYVPGCDFQ